MNFVNHLPDTGNSVAPSWAHEEREQETTCEACGDTIDHPIYDRLLDRYICGECAENLTIEGETAMTTEMTKERQILAEGTAMKQKFNIRREFRSGHNQFCAYDERGAFIGGTLSFISADDCELLLRKVFAIPAADKADLVVREVEL